MKQLSWESPFSEMGKARGSMGIDAADVDNNGSIAIVIGNFSNEKSAFFYAKPGDTYFTDRADNVQISNVSFRLLTFGLLFFRFRFRWCARSVLCERTY